jgi:hypothetical protein
LFSGVVSLVEMVSVKKKYGISLLLENFPKQCVHALALATSPLIELYNSLSLVFFEDPENVPETSFTA